PGPDGDPASTIHPCIGESRLGSELVGVRARRTIGVQAMTNAWSIARTGERPSRSVLLVSLALNLFILGVGGALAVRHFVPGGSTTRPEPARSAAARIDRLAATLPSADAEILRAEFRAREPSVEAANAK